MTDTGSATPPGWYHAAGDPPGTHRYWDGAQWQGGPQLVVGHSPGALSGLTPAPLGSRLLAFIIDNVIPTLVSLPLLLVLVLVARSASAAPAVLILLLWWLAVFGFYVWNLVLRQGSTGQSIGKQQQGIALLDYQGRPVGAGKAFLRWFLGGIIDNFLLLNTLWIFFDADNQRLADKIIDANVYQAPN
ncbi:MAG: RDD family protein [Acidimicrobiales bacterium]|nr:RDD family protein [Acidimicrobiales bacterium]